MSSGTTGSVALGFVYSHHMLMFLVSATTLTRIKCLIKMNEC